MKREKQIKMDKFDLSVLCIGMITTGMVIQKFIIFGLDAFTTIYR